MHPLLPILLWHLGRSHHGLPGMPMPPDFPAHVARTLGVPHLALPVPPLVRPPVLGGGIIGPPQPPVHLQRPPIMGGGVVGPPQPIITGGGIIGPPQPPVRI